MVYLIHFDRPLGHAQHYIGFTDNLQQRLHDHEATCKGSKLLQAVRAAGIHFRVVRTWEGDRGLERRLKNQKKARLLCPVCRKEKSENHI